MATIKLGITGGIGSGKSVVSRLLETMRIPVYIADTQAKRLTTSDAQIRQQLIRLLGTAVFDGDVLNKAYLASRIFGDADCRLAVDKIIHPRVKEDFRQWVAQHSHYRHIAMESAILIESGFADCVDKVVMVYAPLDVRLQRVVDRDRLSVQQVMSRVHSQMPDEQKKKYADRVIDNSGVLPLIPQVQACVHGTSVDCHAVELK